MFALELWTRSALLPASIISAHTCVTHVCCTPEEASHAHHAKTFSIVSNSTVSALMTAPSKSEIPARFAIATNEFAREPYAVIADAGPSERPALQQCLGMKYNEYGIMSNARLLTIWKPIDHMLRDPMHVFLNNGVANSEVAHLMRALKPFGITPEMVNDYVMQFKLPRRHGAVQPHWISRKRLGKKWDQLTSFCGVLLSLLPIILCFLKDVFDETHELWPNVVCFEHLVDIIAIIMLGPDDAMFYVALLEALLILHAEEFSKLYRTAVKPKFHQSFHLIDNMRYLGKLLTCFVTERKHRATKRAALFIFRHIDNTVITDIVNRQCETFAGDTSLFKFEYLHAPQPITVLGREFSKAKTAVLRYGQVSNGDIVYLVDGGVGEVVDFWRFDANSGIVARVRVFRKVDDERWDPRDPTEQIVESTNIIDAVMYVKMGELVRVVPPHIVRVKRMVVDT